MHREATLRSLVRDIPDFPRPGILFKDITPLLADPGALRLCLDLLAERAAPMRAEAIVGIESRGFIFGAALAAKLGLGFVPARKSGKLPHVTHRVEYGLEYGTDSLELHRDGLRPGERALIVDDLIATGGTARAAAELVTTCGAIVAGFAFVVDLAFLEGKKTLEPHPVTALLEY